MYFVPTWPIFAYPVTYFELYMLKVSISYYHDIVILTITIMITIGYHDN